MKRVAVEPNLDQVRAALEGRGFHVMPMDAGRPVRADAYVVSGMEENLMGAADTDGNKAPVINAHGLTAEQVVREVERRAGGGEGR